VAEVERQGVGSVLLSVVRALAEGVAGVERWGSVVFSVVRAEGVAEVKQQGVGSVVFLVVRALAEHSVMCSGVCHIDPEVWKRGTSICPSG